MQGKKKNPPKLFYNFSLEEYIPTNNFYRILKNNLDLSFIYKETKESPPKGITAWLLFLVGLFATGRLNVFITGISSTVKQAKGLWAKIKEKTYRIPLLLSVAGGALWTFYKGGWSRFDLELLPVATAVIFSFTIFLYEEFFKKREIETDPTPMATS